MNDDRMRIVKAYFDALAARDVSRVPWAQDATLRTPLNPAGSEGALIRGRKAILEFYAGVLPVVRGVTFLRCYLSDGEWAAGQAEIALANGNTRYALDAFRIENREIKEQQNHYDSRSATG
jgi:SnoaL-like protein